MSKTVVLSPSIHEAVIKRHQRGDDDPIINGLFEGAKLTREMCQKATMLADLVMKNTLKTEAARHREARAGTFSLIERATVALDAATKSAEAEIATIKARVKGPPPAKDAVQEARMRELRERLSGLDEQHRRAIINDAVKTGDDMIVGAVLNSPGWLSGFSNADLEVTRHAWASSRYPADLERLPRIEAAVEDARRIGTLAMGFVDSLTDAEMISQAEQNEKAANAALRSVRAAG